MQNKDWRREYMYGYMRDLMNRHEGREEGSLILLLSLIRKKLARNMNSKDIADIFEEDEAYIQKLIDKIQANPTKDDTELCLMIFEEKYSGK